MLFIHISDIQNESPNMYTSYTSILLSDELN